jgi:uncharacterized protein YndB with AHSA1/START domain
MMKWTLIIIGVLVAVVAIVAIIGTMLPRDHVASTSATIPAPPESVWHAITDVAAAPQWRDVKSVEILSRDGEKFRWREVGGFGPITFEQQEAVAPRRFVSRVADTDQGFGGTWTYEIEPAANASRVTITERGFVTNPLFRFMSRFVFGYHGAQESYLRALGKKFGGTVTPVRG